MAASTSPSAVKATPAAASAASPTAATAAATPNESPVSDAVVTALRRGVDPKARIVLAINDLLSVSEVLAAVAPALAPDGPLATVPIPDSVYAVRRFDTPTTTFLLLDIIPEAAEHHQQADAAAAARAAETSEHDASDGHAGYPGTGGGPDDHEQDGDVTTRHRYIALSRRSEPEKTWTLDLARAVEAVARFLDRTRSRASTELVFLAGIDLQRVACDHGVVTVAVGDDGALHARDAAGGVADSAVVLDLRAALLMGTLAQLEDWRLTALVHPAKRTPGAYDGATLKRLLAAYDAWAATRRDPGAEDVSLAALITPAWETAWASRNDQPTTPRRPAAGGSVLPMHM
ncbi:hypothetical protein CXG81DRAFT_20136 [Caulochytrium protostelioides]|uniref:Uncharacterized protein n=1 Tax=Caulochytrium protostelioides TaxID=1555241 RepID=A0A4P9X459_9FUNG|nr:hypothetical protein CXG81DRAFT_20136 [Caulochytrium protostelioides]|eukprot:RKO99839.1 hypothetical protein CXG81DRAFT_20136 [Caulochytrium protostelioides]